MQFLYPNDAQVTHKTVCRGADGNCFFRAVAMSLTGKEENHKQLRQLIAEQLCNNPQAIAAALIEKSSSCPGVNPSSLMPHFFLMRVTACSKPQRKWERALRTV